MSPHELWLLATLALLPLAVRLSVLDAPIAGDEGVYTVVGDGILHGRLPYVDLFDHKPPLLHAWYAVGLAPGLGIIGPRLLVGLALSATVLLLAAIGRELWSTRAGLIAAAVFAFSTGLAIHHTEAQGEVLMNLPLVGAVLAAIVTTRGGNGRTAIVFGVLAGAAMMTKPVALWSVIALLGIVALQSPGERRERWRLAGTAVLATGATMALVVTPWLVTEHLDAFLDANLRFNLELGNTLGWGSRGERLFASTLTFLIYAGPMVAIGLVGIIAALRSPDRGDRVPLVWLGGALAGVVSPGFFHHHYWVLMLPPLALVAAFAIERALLDGRWRRLGARGLAGAGVLAVLIALALPLNLGSYAGTAAERHHARHDPAHEERAAREIANVELGHAVRELTDPGDLVHVYSLTSVGAGIYYYAEREPASRFFYGVPERVRGAEVTSQIEADLEATLPAAVVDITMPLAGEPEPQVSAAQLVDRSALDVLLASSYRLAYEDGFGRVYVLRD